MAYNLAVMRVLINIDTQAELNTAATAARTNNCKVIKVTDVDYFGDGVNAGTGWYAIVAGSKANINLFLTALGL